MDFQGRGTGAEDAAAADVAAGNAESAVPKPDHWPHIVPSRELACRLIRTALTDPALLAAVARRSTFHENGFVKIVLTRDSRSSVRLHIWQTTEKHVWAENVHDHRFAFRSCVLAGGLEHRPWSRSGSGEIKSRFHYFPATGASGYRIVYQGNEAISPGQALRIGEGDEYGMRARELHQVRALEPETITFLVEDRMELDSYATVFSDRYDKEIAWITPRILEEADCAALLNSTLRRISYSSS